MMGAGNQQERPIGESSNRIPDSIGYYLAGFADGEGSFNVSFRKRKDYKAKWKISMSFNVSQRDETVLRMFQDVLGCGTLRWRKDGVCYFETTSLTAIREKVIPFFQRYKLVSKKQQDFESWCRIALLMESEKHLTREGLEEILIIRGPMNNGGKRKYKDDEILKGFDPIGILRDHTPDIPDMG